MEAVLAGAGGDAVSERGVVAEVSVVGVGVAPGAAVVDGEVAVGSFGEGEGGVSVGEGEVGGEEDEEEEGFEGEHFWGCG